MADSLPTRTPSSSPDLESEHRRAICDEIGQQLRGIIADDLTPLPSRLEGMVDRLTKLDGDVTLIAPGRQDDTSPRPHWNFVSAIWQVLRHGL